MYYKRIITYDDKTNNYTVELPQLGLKVLADTEMQALIYAREEIEAHIKNQSNLIKKLQSFDSGLSNETLD